MPLDSSDRVWCEDMLRHAQYGIEFIGSMSYDEFVSDLKTRFAVERAVEIIGEAANNLSVDGREQISAILWRSVIAQRHMLAHHYGAVDFLRLWEVATHHLHAMKQELQNALRSIDPEEEIQ